MTQCNKNHQEKFKRQYNPDFLCVYIYIFWDLGIKTIPTVGADNFTQIPGAFLDNLHIDDKWLLLPVHAAQSRLAVLKESAVYLSELHCSLCFAAVLNT